MNIEAILRLDDGPKKTAALVAWIQDLVPIEADVPILVGGAAVELYTSGAYTTGDLDFVGSVAPELAKALTRAGFEKHGRHWIHEDAQVFIEFPGRSLDPAEKAAWIEVEGERVRIITLEDLLVDRLGCWEHWRSAVDGVNAWALLRNAADRLDSERLRQRVANEGWTRALDSLLTFSTRWRDAEPPPEELERWANEGP